MRWRSSGLLPCVLDLALVELGLDVVGVRVGIYLRGMKDDMFEG